MNMKKLAFTVVILSFMSPFYFPVFIRREPQKIISNQPQQITSTQTERVLPTPKFVQTNIQLINPGAEPRQLLRFAPRKNAKQTIQMTANFNETYGQRQPQTSDSLSMILTVQTKVTKVDKNGDIHVKFSYTNMDILAQGESLLAQNLEAVRSKLKEFVDEGLRGSMVIDSQGNMKEANLDPPKSIDSAAIEWLQDSVNYFSSGISLPVPTESVGVGAKWKVHQKWLIDEITLNHFTTYELRGLSNNIAALEIIVEEQTEIPLKPPESTPNESDKFNESVESNESNESIESINGQGRGMAAIGLNRIAPINYNISTTSNTKMKIEVPGSKEKVLWEDKSTAEISVKSN